VTAVLSEAKVNAATAVGLARFWQPIEAAAKSLATVSVQNLPGTMASLVNLLAGDLVPRLRAEENVLLPLVSTERQSGPSVGLNHADVSRLAETISTFALRPAGSDVGRVHRIASTLLAVLGEQRQAEARLVARVRALPAAGRGAAVLGDRLEEEAQASRASQFFVSPADRLPTEAWVLRQNPKPARLEGIAQDRTSAVADLVAVLESA
jgi:hypothetical protein